MKGQAQNLVVLKRVHFLRYNFSFRQTLNKC
jgi:hypothetical protein